jgi:nucleoside-diphosphate-sugar epimerase
VEVVAQQGKNAPPFAKYSASKLLAERAAWEWVKEANPHFDLVTILPSFIFGVGRISILLYRRLTVLQKIISETTADIKGSNSRLLSSLKASALANPSPDALRAEWPLVDVRDVSRHHILGLTVPEAGGERILSSNRTATVQEFSEYLLVCEISSRDIEPATVNILNANPVEGIVLPASQTLSDWQAKVSLSNEKSIKILGAHYRPVEETIRDTVIGALEVGWKQ